MVQSQVVSITPAQHADAHRIGGTDPLTGAVGIDAIPMAYDGTVIHSGVLTSPAWTEIDLSAIVGARRALVVLLVQNNAAANVNLTFRPAGHADIFVSDITKACGNQFIALTNVADKAGIVTLYTSAAGKIEYQAAAGYNVDITLTMYA